MVKNTEKSLKLHKKTINDTKLNQSKSDKIEVAIQTFFLVNDQMYCKGRPFYDANQVSDLLQYISCVIQGFR